MHKLLPIMVLLALGGCAASQDPVLKKLPTAQASPPKCSIETALRTGGNTTSSMVCY